MMDFGFLLKVSRPRFWIYLCGPYLIGLIAGDVSKGQLYDWRLFVFGLYFVLPANLLVYGVNDIFDYETDKLNAKKSSYETLVTPDRRRPLAWAIIILNLPFIAVAASAGNAAFSLAAFLFFSIFYSAPPIRAKAIPFLDSAFNVLYVAPGIFAYQMIAGALPPLPLIAAAALWTAAMHAFSAIPDIDADREANLTTIATVCGPAGTHLFCLAAYICSAALAYQYLGIAAALVGTIYAAIMIFSILNIDENSVFSVYRRFPITNAAVGFALFWYLAILKFF